MITDDTYTETTNSASDPHFELNTKIDEMQRAGMRVTKQWQEMWLTAIKYAWGEQLRDIKPNDDWHYIVVNRIYPLMFQNIAKLAKNHPKVLAFPWSEEKEGVTEFVEQWAGALQYVWESPYELSMRLKLIMGLLDAALFGYMVGKTYWDDRVKYDEQAKSYIGNVRETFIHPATFWVDPAADSVDTAENCGTRRRVTVEWAMNHWPEHKADIKKEGYTSDDPKYVAGDVISYSRQKGSVTDKMSKLSFSKLVNLILKKLQQDDEGAKACGSSQKYVDIEETYWKDYETKHVKIEDNVPSQELIDKGKITKEEVSGIFLDTETGDEVTEWPKKVINEYDESLYPNGRFVLRIGKIILNPDKKDQKYPYIRWPFTVMPYHILPHMWQGGNAIEMARNNNDMLNMTVSALVRRVLLTADPERIVEAGALAKDRKGKLRQINPFGLGKYIIAAKGKGDKIRNLDYANLDPATMALAGILKQDIDDAMFMQDTARGAASTKNTMGGGGGKITATEAARLDTNSHDYTALQAIFLDMWIDNTLTLIAEIVRNKYEVGRIVQIVSNGDERDHLELSEHLLNPNIHLMVNIEPGSTLPFDEEKKKNDYVVAYKMLAEPAVNPLLEDMLRILKISNRKKVLARHQGTILFRQFVQLSQMLIMVPPEQVQAVLMQIPVLQPLYKLMMQAGQLAPAMGIEAPQPQSEKKVG